MIPGIQDPTVTELKDNVARLSRQNDELNKEVGRLRLLEEQHKGASTQLLAAVAEPPTPAKVSPAGQSPPSHPPPSAITVEASDTSLEIARRRTISASETTESAEMIGITTT